MMRPIQIEVYRNVNSWGIGDLFNGNTMLEIGIRATKADAIVFARERADKFGVKVMLITDDSGDT